MKYNPNIYFTLNIDDPWPGVYGNSLYISPISPLPSLLLPLHLVHLHLQLVDGPDQVFSLYRQQYLPTCQKTP